jgi:Right handed beta helix region
MKTLGFAVILLLCYVFPVDAQEVAHDCAGPPSTFRNVWYIDPVNGATEAAGGNGSRAHPWNSLQAVFATTTGYTYPLLTTVPYTYWPEGGSGYVFATGPGAGPIKPGDEILLMSGNYGNIGIGNYEKEITNSSFLTVAAAPGQTPVFAALYIESTNMLAFNGIKVQSLDPAALSLSNGFLIQVKDQGASFPTSNIVFSNMTLSSQDDVSSWTQAQWLNDARSGFSALSSAGGSNTKCISFTNSHITNVRTGAALSAGQTLFSGNEIDHFGDDGIDYAASNLTMTNNYIHDNLILGDGNHPDAMQGQIGVLAAGATVNTFQFILINGNRIIRQTDPNLAFPGGLQGIDAFDSNWDYLTVTNNIVITTACNGISFASVHAGTIANNTVLNDGLLPSSSLCSPGVGVGDKTHEGSSSGGVAVRNNLAASITVYNLDPGVEADHNVGIAPTGGGAVFAWYFYGVAKYYGSPGIYGDADIIVAGGPAAEFGSGFDPSTLSYTVTLIEGAPAIGAGTTAGAPSVDILGVAQPTSYGESAGAYGYPN